MLSKKIQQVVPLDGLRLLVFFENGVIKLFDVQPLIDEYPGFELLNEPAIFQCVQVEPGGHGIAWNEDLYCSEGELWDNGVEIPLALSDFVKFIQYDVISTSEVAALLNCTRQNVDAGIKRGHIEPIKTFPRTKLFLKSSVAV